jgi:transcription elongation factor Elf1
MTAMTPDKKTRTVTCGQCGKPAIAKVNDVPLCVNHYSKLQTANTQAQAALTEQLRHVMAMQNQAAAELENIAGVRPGLFPRIKIPPAPSAPITLSAR